MVVVATPVYSTLSVDPVVSRVRNANGNSFELKIQNPGGNTSGLYDVHYVVVESGVYTEGEHGVTMEAMRFNSTQTSARNDWNYEERDCANNYITPVVLGQIMTDNNDEWSVFWASKVGQRNRAPVSYSISATKQIAEDNVNPTRADEVIGVIVIEAGGGVIGDLYYEAGVGDDIVMGVGNSSGPQTYNLDMINNASTAVLSAAGVDGGNGGWPVLAGADPVSANALNLIYDEDQIRDDERNHTTEEVAYLTFGDYILPYAIQPEDDDTEPELEKETGTSKIDWNIKLVPNPATSITSVWSEVPFSGTYTVFNSRGEIVHQRDFEEMQNIDVNIADWPGGIYYMRVENSSNGEIKTLKLAKIK
jgi:hypothetical protein